MTGFVVRILASTVQCGAEQYEQSNSWFSVIRYMCGNVGVVDGMYGLSHASVQAQGVREVECPTYWSLGSS